MAEVLIVSGHTELKHNSFADRIILDHLKRKALLLAQQLAEHVKGLE